MFYRVLDEQLSKFKLGVIESPVACDISGHTLWFACVDGGLLSIDHQFVVAKVRADHNVTASNKRANLVVIVCIILKELYLGIRGNRGDDLGRIAVKLAESDLGIIQKMFSHQTGKLSSDTGGSNGNSHVSVLCRGAI